jgi:hypothetical protein
VGLLSRAAHAEPESPGDRRMCAGMPEYMPGGAGTDPRYARQDGSDN